MNWELAPDARKLLLHAIKANRDSRGLSEDKRKEFINGIVRAQNEIGNKAAELQPGFRAYATIKDMNDLNRELEKL
jgi:hypothetical protein